MFTQEDYPHSICKGKVMGLIRKDSPNILIELGAGDGSDTEHFFTRLGKDDTYIAVEADPRTVKQFKIQNDKRLLLINAAISNEDKEDGMFHICTGIVPSLGRPHYDGSSTRYPTKETYDLAPWLDYSDVVIPYITLDTIVKKFDLPKVDFIWCDVEGATGEVIDGGLKALAKTKYFYTEVKNRKEYSYEGELWYDEILQKMNAVGFELVFKFQDDALFRNSLL